MPTGNKNNRLLLAKEDQKFHEYLTTDGVSVLDAKLESHVWAKAIGSQV